MLFAAVHDSASGHISALDGPHRGKLSFSQLVQLGIRGAMEARYQLLKFGLGPSPGSAGTHISLRAEREREFCDVVPIWGIDDEKEIVIAGSEIDLSDFDSHLLGQIASGLGTLGRVLYRPDSLVSPVERQYERWHMVLHVLSNDALLGCYGVRVGQSRTWRRARRNSRGPLISRRFRFACSSFVADGSASRSISRPASSEAFAAALRLVRRSGSVPSACSTSRWMASERVFAPCSRRHRSICPKMFLGNRTAVTGSVPVR